MKARFMLLAFLCAGGIGIFSFMRSTEPPTDEAVIRNFYEHQREFEQLRTMLTEDQKLTSVATWGIETSDSPLASVPPEGGFSEARFKQYLALLKTIHAKCAGQDEGSNPEICFGMWSSGFGGDTRHVSVCSSAKAPENRVASLDTFYKSLKPRRPVYRQIQGSWYIWADW